MEGEVPSEPVDIETQLFCMSDQVPSLQGVLVLE